MKSEVGLVKDYWHSNLNTSAISLHTQLGRKKHNSLKNKKNKTKPAFSIVLIVKPAAIQVLRKDFTEPQRGLGWWGHCPPTTAPIRANSSRPAQDHQDHVQGGSESSGKETPWEIFVSG